jgi:chemotaxis protein histidine kinase CheA
MADGDDFAAQLKVLSDAYAAHLPHKIAQIEQAWRQLPSEEWDEPGFQNLHRQVHSLSGSGKTFGFGWLSEAAHTLEAALVTLGQAKQAPDQAQRQHIQGLLGEFHQVLRRDTD